MNTKGLVTTRLSMCEHGAIRLTNFTKELTLELRSMLRMLAWDVENHVACKGCGLTSKLLGSNTCNHSCGLQSTSDSTQLLATCIRPCVKLELQPYMIAKGCKFMAALKQSVCCLSRDINAAATSGV